MLAQPYRLKMLLGSEVMIFSEVIIAAFVALRANMSRQLPPRISPLGRNIGGQYERTGVHAPD